ncbi:hypothetical protein [Roseofilum sp. Guam]|nr:hypothetical protein [Roseofilum sp. Guam]MBP0031260.1 hypothetical protein [Roseofilum sp. Guam]
MKETRFAELSKDWLFRAAPEDFEHRAPTMKDVRIHLRIQHGYFYIFGESSMTVNLVVWKWSEQASDKNFRRRQKLKMSDYALALANGDDQYCGQFDFSGFVG